MATVGRCDIIRSQRGSVPAFGGASIWFLCWGPRAGLALLLAVADAGFLRSFIAIRGKPPPNRDCETGSGAALMDPIQHRLDDDAATPSSTRLPRSGLCNR